MQPTRNRGKLVLSTLLLALMALASLPALQGLISSAHAAKCDQWGCIGCTWMPKVGFCCVCGPNTCECCECRIVNKEEGAML